MLQLPQQSSPDAQDTSARDTLPIDPILEWLQHSGLQGAFEDGTVMTVQVRAVDTTVDTTGSARSGHNRQKLPSLLMPSGHNNGYNRQCAQWTQQAKAA